MITGSTRVGSFTIGFVNASARSHAFAVEESGLRALKTPSALIVDIRIMPRPGGREYVSSMRELRVQPARAFKG
jgi:hypothetical protein